MSFTSQRARIGIAVGAQSVIGIARRGDIARVSSVPLLMNGGPDDAAALSAAFIELRALLDAAMDGPVPGAVAHIALLPPHADARLVPLPPLRPNEAAAVVRRDAGRYFVGIPAPRLAGVLAAPRGAKYPGSVLAAAASSPLVEAVRSAAASASWRAMSIVPAHAAWLSAAGGKVPDAVIAVDGDTAHVIRTADGTVASLRRVSAASLSDIAAAAGEPGTVAIYAESGMRDRLARELTSHGWTPTGLIASAAEVAARHAETAGLELIPATFEAERRDTEKKVAARLAAAAVVLVIGAAAVNVWGAQRELGAVRARRAEIRGDVGPLLALRDSIDRLGERTADIESLASKTPRWTNALFDLAVLLPPESYITHLTATGDTLIIEGEGARAGEALEALRGAGSLRDARLLGTVDRELEDGATAIERFRLSARLAGSSVATADGAAAPEAGKEVVRR